jgi:hypothetical protein
MLRHYKELIDEGISGAAQKTPAGMPALPLDVV